MPGDAPPKSQFTVDIGEFVTRLLKYMFEGIFVAIAAYTLPRVDLPFEDVVQIAAVAMATFSILDFFAPSISRAARMGAGAGIGANMVGFPR